LALCATFALAEYTKEGKKAIDNFFKHDEEVDEQTGAPVMKIM